MAGRTAGRIVSGDVRMERRCAVRRCDCGGTRVEPCGCDHATETACARHAAWLDWWADAVDALGRMAVLNRWAAAHPEAGDIAR